MTEPRILPGCEVLPPMNPRRMTSNNGKAEKPKRTETTSNRFRELNAFVDCSLIDLSRAEALTWLVLWRDTKQGGTVRTSSVDIARRIGTSRRAVTNALARLRKRGLLRLVHRGGLNRGVSIYRVIPWAKPP
jgi:CRP-like cAMP-binding protein